LAVRKNVARKKGVSKVDDTPEIVKVKWHEMEETLNALADVIDSELKITEHGGTVDPYLKLGKFSICIPITSFSPPFSQVAFKIAEKLGINVAADKSGVIIEVGGKKWNQMIAKINDVYARWKMGVKEEKAKVLSKVAPVSQS
jgi:hypothetical protein